MHTARFARVDGPRPCAKVLRARSLIARIVRESKTEGPPHHHRKGGTYRVNVKLVIPGAEIATARESSKNHAHEDLYVALRDAFNAAVRQLEDHVQLLRGDVKTHLVPLPGESWSARPTEGFR